MTFAMAVALRPVSIQGESTKRFARALREEAVSRFASDSPLAGDLYARIVWLYRRNPADVDNIIKPILDALKGVVYADDHAIVKCSSERVATTRDYDLDYVGAPPNVANELDSLLIQSHEHILYVEVGSLSSRHVASGPIDGGV